jgi:hypothetical protein
MQAYVIFLGGSGGGGGGVGDTIPPVIPAGQVINVPASAAASTVVGHINSTDNIGVTFMDIVSGNTSGAFYLAPSGDLFVNSPAAVQANPSFVLTVIARDAAGNETSQTVSVVVTSAFDYQWENRPPYVEPNPGAAAGTPGRTLADSLGLVRRVNVASQAQWNSAVAAFQPGDQLYVTANIVGNGSSVTAGWYGTNAPNGGGGSSASGTAARPGMITCAPGIWIDGGLASGTQNLNSRALYFAGVDHVWLYGANVRRANFLCAFNQCDGTPAVPNRVWYCNFVDSGHSMLAISGNFNFGGSSAYWDLRYNQFDNAGLGSQEFGEALYLGYGSSNSPTLHTVHDVTIVANRFTNLPAEACDQKAGTYNVKFNYNLIENCNDHATPARTGNAANVGFPGAYQHPGQTPHPTSTWHPNTEIIGNRWKNCTSASTKYPDGLVLVGHRGFKVVGNLFDGINVGSAGLIVAYMDGNVPTTYGQAGTFQVHNNTARNCNSMNAMVRVTVAGTPRPAELAVGQANMVRSNNVISNSPAAGTGADYTVPAGAFTTDGTGYPGGDSDVAPGGALDVTGANTTGQWTSTYAGETVAVPVAPGARQRGGGGGPTYTGPTVKASYVHASSGASMTVNVADFTATPANGDKILWLLPAAGPSAAATVTWTHPGGTTIIDAPGAAFNPRVRAVLSTYATGTTSYAFAVTGGAQVRPLAIVFNGATAVTAGTATSAFTNTPDATSVANAAQTLGLFFFTANYNDGLITGGPADHQMHILSTSVLYQAWVGSVQLTTAGTYDPGPGAITNAGDNTTAVAFVVS